MKIARWIALFSLIALCSSLAVQAAETPDGTAISEVANQQPSMWDRMKSGTSNAWYKSTSVFRKKPAPPMPITGARPSATNKTTEVSSYDKNKAKADGPPTVGSFLGQPRVGTEPLK